MTRGIQRLLPFLLLTALLSPASPVYAVDSVAVVSSLSASEGPAAAADGHPVSCVAVAFTRPADANWLGVEIYAAGQGGLRLVAAGASSPLSFTAETTGGALTVYAVSLARDGRRSSLAGSPSVTVVLDGLPSPPVPVSNLFAQAVGGAVRLSWSESLEGDIAQYQIAILPVDSAPLDSSANLPIAATVPAAGAKATRKAMWDDAAGTADLAPQYYVRAMNSSGQVSEWSTATLNPDNALRTLAPDGTTDFDVPNWNVMNSLGLSISGDGTARYYISWSMRWTFNANAPFNKAGINALWIKVFYRDANGVSSRTFRFEDTGAQALSPDDTRTFTIELPGVTLLGEEHWFENYFGQGAQQGITYAVPRFTGARAGNGPEGRGADPAAMRMNPRTAGGAILRLQHE